MGGGVYTFEKVVDISRLPCNVNRVHALYVEALDKHCPYIYNVVMFSEIYQVLSLELRSLLPHN